MTYVRAFEGFKPPRRYDNVAFDEVDIQEAAAEAGPWTTIDTQALSPVDPDPANPQLRNFTTDDATLAAGWYRIVWRDPNNATFEGDPLYYAALLYVPSADEIRAWSQVDFADRGFGDGTESPDPLDRVLELASAKLQQWTGRNLATSDPSDEMELLAPQIRHAIQMMVEHATAAAQEEHSETAADIAMIESFTAGSYSEKRRTGRMIYRFHPWRELDDLLWEIATPTMRSSLSGGAPGIGIRDYEDVPGEDLMLVDFRRVLTPFGPYNPPWD